FPVLFFNASTRVHNISLNAAYSQLVAWGLRLSGVPVTHFVCQSGMSRCVLGTYPDDYLKAPPCQNCIAQSQRLYAGGDVDWFQYMEDPNLAEALSDLSLTQMLAFEYEDTPYGEIVVHALRWVLRKYDLDDDVPTRSLLREFILSAHHVGREIAVKLEELHPAAVVIFNGMMFPEAMARRVALEKNISVVTHEVSFQPLAGFFTSGEATAYPVDIPEDFELSPEQNKRLDAYLEKRFQGIFTMAGINFWPQIQGLDAELLAKIDQFKQVVPIFTNVVFDTSQPHANTVFENMFAWLDTILQSIKTHPEALFVIRAHPDEMRPGTRKQARQSVRQWVEKNQLLDLPNVVFIDSGAYVSSYELIQRAKFVFVYNSSIGLEATLLGKPVLCGGRARYTQYPIVFFPQTKQGYHQQAGEFLQADRIPVPEAFRRNARRFYYYQLFRTSLPFDTFLETHQPGGYVRLKAFSVDQLKAENAPAIQVVHNGLFDTNSFLLDDEE
ncbi:MAG: hypothetical protein N2D54_03770, partial [Chloroflexota bacterium]